MTSQILKIFSYILYLQGGLEIWLLFVVAYQNKLEMYYHHPHCFQNLLETLKS